MDRIKLINKVKQKFPQGKGIEIGTFKGQFAKTILENWEGILYMVDPWRPLGEEYTDASNHKDHLDAYAKTIENIQGFENRGFMLRALSNQVVNLFKDNSLDFVYIDGNHAYDYVKEDMEIWYPKLKKGGYFMGHDYLGVNGDEWWYSDKHWADEKKQNKHIFMGSEDKNEQVYAGLFGVNTAVDEFGSNNNLKINITDEWLGTWWFTKP
jgi:hypothetical protein